MGKLTKEEIVTLNVLVERDKSKRAVAREMGVTEGTVRYHVGRKQAGAVDGRKGKVFKAKVYRKEIDAFMAGADDPRERNIRGLYDELVEGGYGGSYRSVLRYVQRHYGKAAVRPFRRVETPPGVQAQTDWIEARAFLESEGGWVPVHGLAVKLSHSRARVVVWRLRQDLGAWMTAHTEAWRRLGGIPAVERVDNVKTAAAVGAGPHAVIHPVYAAYARELRYHVECCRVRTPRDKGKVEREVRFVRQTLRLEAVRFRDLEDLQRHTDRKLEAAMRRLICPVTGKTVEASWQEEQRALTPLPDVFPVPFDVVVQRPVGRDCLVHFEGRQYSVPFIHVGREAQVRGGLDGWVRIVVGGTVVAQHPRGTDALLVIRPEHFDGESTETVIAPTPLGKASRLIQELAAQGAPKRALDYYQALVEVHR